MAIGDRNERKEKSQGLNCRFETHGRRCMLTGDISPHTGGDPKFYCAFHYVIVTGSSAMNTYKRFSDWLEEYREMYPVDRYYPIYLDDNGMEQRKVGQFHKYDRNKLWELMGNGEL